MGWLDLLERTVWTALQAFAASVVVTGGMGVGDLKLAALAAVIAAAKSISVSSSVRTGVALAASGEEKRQD